MLYNIQYTGCLVFCVMFRKSLFVLFLLAIMLSVLLRFMDFDYHFGIFKHFLELGVHDATFSNISAIFLEISFIRGENHIPVPSH